MIANANRILWLPEGESRHWDYESGSFGGSRNPAGVRIDSETALRSTVVLACIRVLSTSVAGLPLHLYRRVAGGGKELAREHPLYRILHDQPNAWQTSFEWREQLMLHLLTTGQAFDEKVYSGGQLSELVPLHPSRMKTDRIENGRLRYTYREDAGGSTVYTQDAVMTVRGMSDDGVHGMSMIELARDAIGLARACEIHGASFFGNGARPGVVLSTDQMLSPEAAQSTRDQWERAHRGPDRAHRTAVLQGGLKVNELGGNHQEAQFLEARRFQVEEVCRIYGVPPHLAGDLSRSSFSNIEQQSLDYLQNGLMPWLRRIESSIARDLLDGDDQYFAEFDTRGVLRADAAGRSAYYQTLWNLGVASINEIRSWENMNPVEGGDTRFVQLNMTPLANMAGAIPAHSAEIQPVIDRLASGTISPDAAKALISATNTMLSPDQVNAIVAGSQTASQPDKAQVTALLQVIADVASGILTPAGATAIIGASFPQLDAAQVAAIVGGVKVGSEQQPAQPKEPAATDASPNNTPAASDNTATPEQSTPASRSLPELRALTISMDFDRTFAADPQLWGEFARKSVADGNTVVMISRRTEADRQEVMDTLGDYADAFSQVLLIGGDTLKADAAKAAGIDVDVWVDDSPQTITDEPAPGAKQ